MRLNASLIGMCAVALTAAAPQLPAQTPTKVAIINVQGAILATKDGEKARAQITSKFEPKSKDMESRMAEINKLRETLSKGSNTMAADAKDKLTRDIEDKQKRYQWDAEDFQNEVQQEEQKVVGEIGQRLMQVVDEYAKANAFAVVLDVSPQQSPVLWAANGIDITRDIVERYDKKFGAGTGSTGAGAAPAAPAAKPAAPSAPTAKPTTPAKK